MATKPNSEWNPQSGPFLVGAYEVDAITLCITKDGRSVKLEPRAMGLLVYLARCSGTVITREELEREIWRDMVVGYDALSNAVAKLRKAFNDDRKNPQFIETVPKVGYRLIAKVDHEPAINEDSANERRPQRKIRKLAAILYADVAEYSRLTETDEEGTHDILSDYLDTITRAIEHHNGNVVHYAGDAVLAEFTTVVEALSCSVEVQRDLAALNAGQPADATVQFRMGINLGDVIVDRDDIYGEGVNVAARLESLADPGGICISESVRGAIGKKLPLSFEFLGEQLVKNIAEPVRAYRVVLTQETTPAKSKPISRSLLLGAVAFAVLVIVVGNLLWFKPWREGTVEKMLPLPDKPSIAVLPFTNMTDDPAQEHFADGMTDDLITDLSKISGLFVIARHSVFTYKDKSIPTRQVAEDLGVRYVLAGSIRQTAGQIRINAQLIDATTDGQLWAERYSADPEDIFDVQGQVIKSIVSVLGFELTDAEQKQLARAPTANLEAYDYYLRAERRRVTSTSDLEVNEIPEFYLRALELDPRFIAARTGLARAALRIWQVDNAQVMPPTAARKLAYESASQALLLDPENPDAYAVLALLQATEGEYEVAEESARKAVALNTNQASTYVDLAVVLGIAGKHSEALTTMETAFRFDPKPTPDVHGEYGRLLFFDGQYQRAVKQLVKSRNISNRYDTALAAAYVELDRIPEAKAALVGPFEWRPFANLAYFRILWAHYQETDLNHITRALAKAGVPEWPYRYQPAVETRLDTAGLKALTAGRTWTGHDYGGASFVQQFIGDGRVAFRDHVSLLSGTARLRDNLLCIRYPAAMLGREDCGHVYRQAGGSPQEQNEYVHVTIGEVYFFSASP